MSRLNEYAKPKEKFEEAIDIIRLADLLSTTTKNLLHPQKALAQIFSFQRAIDKHDSTTAMYKLAILLCESATRTPSDEDNVLAIIHRAVNNDHEPWHAKMGLIHHFGWGPCNKHASRSVFYFQRAF